jgi:hypothetical protein
VATPEGLNSRELVRIKLLVIQHQYCTLFLIMAVPLHYEIVECVTTYYNIIIIIIIIGSSSSISSSTVVFVAAVNNSSRSNNINNFILAENLT